MAAVRRVRRRRGLLITSHRLLTLPSPLRERGRLVCVRSSLIVSKIIRFYQNSRRYLGLRLFGRSERGLLRRCNRKPCASPPSLCSISVFWYRVRSCRGFVSGEHKRFGFVRFARRHAPDETFLMADVSCRVSSPHFKNAMNAPLICRICGQNIVAQEDAIDIFSEDSIVENIAPKILYTLAVMVSAIFFADQLLLLLLYRIVHRWLSKRWCYIDNVLFCSSPSCSCFCTWCAQSAELSTLYDCILRYFRIVYTYCPPPMYLLHCMSLILNTLN